MNLESLFNPRSVAVIGASSDPSKVGYALLKNIVDGDPTRDVYPITLNAKEILGKKAFTSIMEVPEEVDLAVIAVRADIVPKVLHDCAHAGITAAVIISAGFKEVGEAGAKLEAELRETAAEHGIALVGPNCLGVMDAHADWNASFAVEKPLPGRISFVSQSGALGTALLDWANREGVGFAKFVSLGNEAALTELAFLDYLAKDTETGAVLLYAEHIEDGPSFMKAVRALTRRKPLVVLQAGTSKRGSSAVSSHTGSLAPESAVFETALRQSGAIPVKNLRELFSFAKLFHDGFTTPVRNLVILTNGGGPSVNTADVLENAGGLSLTTFSEETKTSLREVLPPMAAVGNPIDVIGDAGPERYHECLKVLTKLPEVDAILALVTPQMMTNAEEITRVLLAHRGIKPIIPCLMGGAAVEQGVAVLREARIANFEFPSDAIQAFAGLAHTESFKKVIEAPAQQDSGTTNLRMLHIDEMQTLLSAYNIRAEGEFVREGTELAGALGRLGAGPYAIKAISQELVHKSDLKAVQLHLESKQDLERAWAQIYQYVQAHSPGAVIDGMLVQRMIKGTEIIIGMKRDRTFGPVIVVGIGGIFVEILKDASMRIAPITKEEALVQIHELKSIALLTGARGTEPANLQALANIVVALSTLSMEHPEVLEVDCNPVFATPTGAHIVDVRIMV